jgi:acetyl-CoA carboxylase biotin carboxyl carrier protein
MKADSMPDKEKSAGEPFDLERLKQLIRLMEKHDLTEIKLKHRDQKWVLRRGGHGNRVSGFPGTPAQATHAPPTSLSPGAPAPVTFLAANSETAASEAGLLEIVSPTVGTFYSAPQPGDPAFVRVGDRVSPETVVCLVEAMKVFNQIPAEVSGNITKVLVNDGDAVEFGQALFLVRPG